MADDEGRVMPGAPQSDPATPNRGKRREPPTIDGVATSLEPAPTEPTSTEAASTEITSAEAETAAAGPGFAVAAADLADGVPTPGDMLHTPEPIEAESAADNPPPPRSVPDKKASSPTAWLSLLTLLLLLLAGAVAYLIVNPPGNNAVAGLTDESVDLKQRIAKLEARPADKPVDLGPLQDRLAGLESSVGQLKSDLADLKAKVDTPPAAAPQPDTAPVAQAAPAAPAVDLAPLQGKVADLEKSVDSVRDTVANLPKVDVAPLTAKIADIGQTVTLLQGTVATLPRVDLGPVDQKIEALDKRLVPIESQLAPPKSDQQVTEARQEGSAAETRAAPLAVTGQVILQAIAQGKPFEPALAALQNLGVDAGRLKPLAAVASTGAPTDADLLQAFERVKDTIVGASAPAPTGSMLDRVMSSAQGLVKVRPAGAAAGQDADAVVSRIEADLQHHNRAGALAEWNGLPADGKAKSQAWADTLKVRLDAEAAARAVVDDAVVALGTAK